MRLASARTSRATTATTAALQMMALATVALGDFVLVQQPALRHGGTGASTTTTSSSSSNAQSMLTIAHAAVGVHESMSTISGLGVRGYKEAFVAAVDRVGLEATNPAVLACLYARTRNKTYAEGAVVNLAAAASGTKPLWLKQDRVSTHQAHTAAWCARALDLGGGDDDDGL
jgi:hypothetical protein